MVYKLYPKKAIVFLKGLSGLIGYDLMYLKFRNGQKRSMVRVFRKVVTMGATGCGPWKAPRMCLDLMVSPW